MYKNIFVLDTLIILKRPTFVPLNLIPAFTTAISEEKTIPDVFSQSKRNSGSCYGWTYVHRPTGKYELQGLLRFKIFNR